jgi:hypothetical protein
LKRRGRSFRGRRHERNTVKELYDSLLADFRDSEGFTVIENRRGSAGVRALIINRNTGETTVLVEPAKEIFCEDRIKSAAITIKNDQFFASHLGDTERVSFFVPRTDNNNSHWVVEAGEIELGKVPSLLDYSRGQSFVKLEYIIDSMGRKVKDSYIGTNRQKDATSCGVHAMEAIYEGISRGKREAIDFFSDPRNSEVPIAGSPPSKSFSGQKELQDIDRIQRMKDLKRQLRTPGTLIESNLRRSIASLSPDLNLGEPITVVPTLSFNSRRPIAVPSTDLESLGTSETLIDDDVDGEEIVSLSLIDDEEQRSVAMEQLKQEDKEFKVVLLQRLRRIHAIYEGGDLIRRIGEFRNEYFFTPELSVPPTVRSESLNVVVNNTDDDIDINTILELLPISDDDERSRIHGLIKSKDKGYRTELLSRLREAYSLDDNLVQGAVEEIRINILSELERTESVKSELSVPPTVRSESLNVVVNNTDDEVNIDTILELLPINSNEETRIRELIRNKGEDYGKRLLLQLQEAYSLDNNDSIQVAVEEIKANILSELKRTESIEEVSHSSPLILNSEPVPSDSSLTIGVPQLLPLIQPSSVILGNDQVPFDDSLTQGNSVGVGSELSDVAVGSVDSGMNSELPLISDIESIPADELIPNEDVSSTRLESPDVIVDDANGVDVDLILEFLLINDNDEKVRIRKLLECESKDYKLALFLQLQEIYNCDDDRLTEENVNNIVKDIRLKLGKIEDTETLQSPPSTPDEGLVLSDGELVPDEDVSIDVLLEMLLINNLDTYRSGTREESEVIAMRDKAVSVATELLERGDKEFRRRICSSIINIYKEEGGYGEYETMMGARIAEIRDNLLYNPDFFQEQMGGAPTHTTEEFNNESDEKSFPDIEDDFLDYLEYDDNMMIEYVILQSIIEANKENVGSGVTRRQQQLKLSRS